MATRKSSPTIGAPTPEDLTKFIAGNNLPRIPTPQAFPGAPLGTTPTSKNRSNVVPQVNGNVGVENRGTSTTSPLLPATPGGIPQRPIPREPPVVDLGAATIGGTQAVIPQERPTAPSITAAQILKDAGFDPAVPSPTPAGSFIRSATERPQTAPEVEEVEAPGVEVDPIQELIGALTGGDLEELLRVGSVVEPFPTFSTLELRADERGNNVFVPKTIFDEEFRETTLTADPTEQAEAAAFLQRFNLRQVAKEKGDLALENEARLAGAVQAEQQFTIDLPENARAATAIRQVGPVIQAASKEMVDILALPAGPDKAATVQAFLAKEMAPLPSEVRWDTATASFTNARGFEGLQRSEETIKYLAQVKPIFEMRDTMQSLVDLQVKNESALLFARQSAEQSATLFREQMASSQIDSAEESLAKQRLFEQQQIDEENKKFQIATLIQLMSNPTTMALSRFYGVLGQFEEFLGIQIPFGRSMSLPGGGALPGVEEWGGMTGYEKLISREEWKATNGGTDEDFGTAMLSQQPGAATQATTVTAI